VCGCSGLSSLSSLICYSCWLCGCLDIMALRPRLVVSIDDINEGSRDVAFEGQGPMPLRELG
jgi:hypothetical protein